MLQASRSKSLSHKTGRALTTSAATTYAPTTPNNSQPPQTTNIYKRSKQPHTTTDNTNTQQQTQTQQEKQAAKGASTHPEPKPNSDLATDADPEAASTTAQRVVAVVDVHTACVAIAVAPKLEATHAMTAKRTI